MKVIIAEIIYILATQRAVWRPADSESSGCLLDMQNSRSHPRLPEPEPARYHVPQVIPSLKLGKQKCT